MLDENILNKFIAGDLYWFCHKSEKALQFVCVRQTEDNNSWEYIVTDYQIKQHSVNLSKPTAMTYIATLESATDYFTSRNHVFLCGDKLIAISDFYCQKYIWDPETKQVQQ